jgi:hypothetical protein
MLIFTRTACLGGDCTQLKIGTKHDFYNQQKIRVDMFVDVVINGAQKPNKEILLSLLDDPNETGGVYSQSEEFRWLSVTEPPQYIFMDNYSELVDKKIMHKDGWSFCGLYGDFKLTAFSDGTLTDKNLLPIDQIYNYYNLFFKYIRDKWSIPIIFIHFPTTLDPREMYIKQGVAVSNALENLSSKYNIQNIHADSDAIEGTDNNYYHFTAKTKQNIANKITL